MAGGQTIVGAIFQQVALLARRVSALETQEIPQGVEGVGNGVAGRAAEWSDDHTITAAEIALAGVAGKTLTVNENLTLAGVSGKTLTVNENLTLAGATGKSLTLTTNLTNQGANGILDWGGAYTLSINGSCALAGSGTLTINNSPTVGGTGTLTLTTNLTNSGGNGTLDWGGAYTLSINQNLTLAGATGKSLTLTQSLVNEGSNTGTLHWDGAYTLTIGATGTATLGAGTCTLATTNNAGIANHTHELDISGAGYAQGAGTLTAATVNNDAIADHTHAITASANTSAGGASILKSDANGGLELDRLGIDTAAAATGDLTVAMDGRFGGGLYVGDTGVNPAAGTLSTEGNVGVGCTALAGYPLDVAMSGGASGFYVHSDGDIYAAQDCSALTFTDRTPFPKDKATAYSAVLSQKKKPDSDELDHDALDPYLKKAGEYRGDRAGNMKPWAGRNLSATVSALVVVTQDLLSRLEKLEGG